MKFSARIIIPLIVFHSALFASAQKDSVLFKGVVFHKVDADYIYLDAHGKIKLDKGVFYDDKDGQNPRHLSHHSTRYLDCYLHEYEHTKADYIYTDQAGNIVAWQQNRVKLLQKGRKKYVYHFKHTRTVAFLADHINGIRIKRKKYSYSFIRTVWAPPKF
jgi:hypothetical protein